MIHPLDDELGYEWLIAVERRVCRLESSRAAYAQSTFHKTTTLNASLIRIQAFNELLRAHLEIRLHLGSSLRFVPC